MKALLLVALLAASPSSDPWFGTDKVMHFTMSAFSAGAAFAVTDRPLLAFGLGLVPGIAKEAFDAMPGGSGFSYRDLTADAAGALVGAFLVWTVDHLLARGALAWTL